MGTIRAHEFTTLDGVVDEPTFTFGYEHDPRMGKAIGNLMGSCEAILLGRKTYQMFEPAWSARTAEDDPGAPFMNDTAKFVVSSTLRQANWRNTEILGTYDPEAIRRLKARVNGGIYVSGSATLVRALIADDLLDELHLFVFPTTLGAGARLFTKPPARKWSLKRSEAYGSGAVYLAYRHVPAGG